jgi:ABC-type polysaccharide/polyol phosphate transport system ATPase subunit
MPEDTLAVQFENVSVKYRSPVESYWSFKEYAVRLLEGRVAMKEFLALRNVDLEVRRGEIVGIIGRNGAGKSTLLKLVSRVLAPTSGRVVTRGYVAPMLELGAGFHYELTGRENIFLNGALLGHPQSEIKAHLQEILDFAQIDGYVDAPLRTYSSGMVARLGFAVATSWVPEILILDEVLAVGDEDFRRKCHERIKSFRCSGTTILLVSHNMEAVQSLCERAVWLEQGRIMNAGNVSEVIRDYRSFIPRQLPLINLGSD